MLFLCGTQTSFLCPMLGETMKSYSYLPQFLDITAQFLGSCSVLFINCQMPQGENSCRMSGLLSALSICPGSWPQIWVVLKVPNSRVCLCIPIRLTKTCLRFPGSLLLISALLFSLLDLCSLSNSRFHEVKHTQILNSSQWPFLFSGSMDSQVLAALVAF